MRDEIFIIKKNGIFEAYYNPCSGGNFSFRKNKPIITGNNIFVVMKSAERWYKERYERDAEFTVMFTRR